MKHQGQVYTLSGDALREKIKQDRQSVISKNLNKSPIPFDCGVCSKVFNFEHYSQVLDHIEQHQLEIDQEKKRNFKRLRNTTRRSNG